MQLVEGITVPAGGKAVLERGGYHLMLLNPKPLNEGDRYILTLRFGQSGQLNVEVPVTGLTSGEAGEGHSGHASQADRR